jgi:hypothetical protein
LGDGTQLESGWTGHDQAAVVDDPKQHGTAGWISYTDHYDGVMPKVSRFGEVTEEHVTQVEVPQAEALPHLSHVEDFFISSAPAVASDVPFYPDEDDEDDEEEEDGDADPAEDEEAAFDEEFCLRA